MSDVTGLRPDEWSSLYSIEHRACCSNAPMSTVSRRLMRSSPPDCPPNCCDGYCDTDAGEDAAGCPADCL